MLAELGLVPTVPAGVAPVDAAGATRDEPLLAALRGETLHAEELAARTATPLADTLTRLVELELAGRVARAPGGLWRLE